MILIDMQSLAIAYINYNTYSLQMPNESWIWF